MLNEIGLLNLKIYAYYLPLAIDVVLQWHEGNVGRPRYVYRPNLNVIFVSNK